MVIVLVTNHFEDRICLSQLKQVNKSMIFFFNKISGKKMAETIRSTDSFKENAELMQHSFSDTDFDLNDRYCVASDFGASWSSVPIPESSSIEYFCNIVQF